MEPAGDGRYRDAERVGPWSDVQSLQPDLTNWLPELVWTCQPDGTCDFLNQRWLEYTGMAPEARPAGGWLARVHPEDRAQIAALWQAALQHAHDFRVELRLERRDGAYRRFDMRVCAVRDARAQLARWLGLCIDVQDQWELRERLRAKTEQLERLVAAVPGVICTYEHRPDQGHSFPYASPAMWDVYGIDPEQAAQDAAYIFDRIHPDDAVGVGLAIQASASTLSPWHGEFRYAHPTKGERHLEGFSAPAAHPDGRMQWHGIIFDITQQHQEQLALHAAEQRAAARDRISRSLAQVHSLEEGLTHLIETLCHVEGWQLGAIWLQASDGGPLCCAARWHEASLAPALASLLAASEPGQSASPEHATELQELLARGLPLALPDARALAGSRELRAGLAAASGMRSALYCPMLHGTSLRALVELVSTREQPDARGSVELIAALGSQVYLTMERLNAELQLRRSEQRLKSVIEHMSEGLVVADPDLVLRWNPAALAMHAFADEDDCRRRLPEFETQFEISTLDGQVLPLEHWPMSRILRGEKLRGLELRVRRLDCEWGRVLGYGGAQVEQPDGRVLSFLSITDLTDRTRATEALQHLNQELEQRVAQRTSELLNSNKELESFSYSVSHDLRAPLRAMNGYAQVLLEDFAADLPPEAQRLLRVIGDSGKRMGELIDDLLALSRMSRKELSLTRVDMRALATGVLAETHYPGQERARVQVGRMPECLGDPNLLRHVWSNLLSNAFKYARHSRPIEVEIQGELTPEGEARYSVRDNGAGFDMRYVHKLFGVFQRLHSEEEFEGTGVGLAIVHRIVTRHGGRVWASAVLGQGATFGFSLPRATPP